MTFAWPKSLIPEVAERRCIIVLGAGASAGARGVDSESPPTWSELLKKASQLLEDDDDRRLVRSLISSDRYLDAAEIVIGRVNKADYAAFIRQLLVDPHFSQTQIHEEVVRLDPKIVVTTNYDEIYEAYCKAGSGSAAYNVCRYYESHAINDIRSKMRVILKAHGCVSDPQKTVLSRTQYHFARRDYPEFFNLLDSLFLVNTVLFIGCSLVDPDFQLLLENSNIKCPSAHPHYAVVPSGTSTVLLNATLTVYNVKCLEFPKGDYEEVVESLKELNLQVGEWRRTHP
jgi:hypothetical protein